MKPYMACLKIVFYYFYEQKFECRISDETYWDSLVSTLPWCPAGLHFRTVLVLPIFVVSGKEMCEVFLNT